MMGMGSRGKLGAISALALLSACGGGGGSSGGPISTPPPVPTPTPTPTPAPTPTPTPPPTGGFATEEVNRSDGPLFHNAPTAWAAGATGAGIKIGIIDSGIDLANREFAGRIDPASADVTGAGRSAQQIDDHGTHVALIAAAALDNNGIVGIAHRANVIALRADTPGTCAGTSAPDADLDCTFADRAIAAGIDRAVSAGAAVINLSLGGGAIDPVLVTAVRNAANAGAVIVVAAGNGGDGSEPGIDPNQPDPFASSILAAGGANVVIVGSVREDRTASDFSNRAGNAANSYLMALGERICCVYQGSEILITTEADGRRYVTLFSGTSFAAPQVSGAAALLKQAFPNLTGRQIVEILLSSARDAGTAGVDTVYGRGIMDIAAAFQPRGATVLAGGTAVVPLGEAMGSASGPMGDALTRASAETVLLDQYDRAYAVDLARGFRTAQGTRRLQGAVDAGVRRLSGASESSAVAFTVDARRTAGVWAAPLRLSQEEAERARVLAGRLALRLGRDTQLGLAFAEGADGLTAQLQGQQRPAFLIAGSAGGDAGVAYQPGTAIALRRQIGPWGVTLAAEQGRAYAPSLGAHDLTGDGRALATRTFSAAADRRFSAVDTRLVLSWMQEDATVLGARFHRALGAGGADSLFLDAGAGYAFAPGWRLGADLRRGLTAAAEGGQIAAGSRFASSGWSVDLTRSGALVPGDSVGLRLAQPLRVTGGGLKLNLPTGYDYASETAHWGTRSVALSPEGRELMGELGWRGPLWSGDGAVSMFYRREPGHQVAAPDDAGLVLKWSRGF